MGSYHYQSQKLKKLAAFWNIKLTSNALFSIGIKLIHQHYAYRKESALDVSLYSKMVLSSYA